jgi:hypothetical protein
MTPDVQHVRPLLHHGRRSWACVPHSGEVTDAIEVRRVLRRNSSDFAAMYGPNSESALP